MLDLKEASAIAGGLHLQENGGNGMIKALKIKNFRGFESLELDGFKRVNIIVGPNGTGKTALLEAAFLASGGSPEIALRFRVTRGLGSLVELSAPSLDAVWRDIFHNFASDTPVQIDITGTDGDDRRLTIAQSTSDSLTLPMPSTRFAQAGKPLSDVIIKSYNEPIANPPITFSWTDTHGRVFQSRPRFTANGMELENDSRPNRAAFFSSFTPPNAEEGARLLSDIVAQNEKGLFLSSLQEVFKSFEDIMPLQHAGTWMVHVKLSTRRQIIPLALHSAGASRLAQVMLQMATQKRGVVLVDEIENGVYYAHLARAWRSLLAMSKKCDTQLIATTHSRECIQAACEALRNDAEELALIRFGDTKPRVIAGPRVEDALSEGFELR